MKKPVLIEIFIWTIFLGIIFSAIIFAYSKLFIEPNIYTIQFKDIDGITTGSPVRFMGMNIGYVRNLISSEKFVNVEIIVTKKEMKIPNGTIARVEFYGLGGSKSVELMPPDGSCNVGILTDSTIRINDVVREAIGIVDIIEGIEKYVKGINKGSTQSILETASQIKDTTLKDANIRMVEFSKSQEEKFDKIKIKQKDLQGNIEKINESVQKINQFIKK